MVRHSRILYLLLCLLVLVVAMVFGLVRRAATPVPTSPPVPAPTSTPASMPTPIPTPFVPIVEPSPFTPWVKSDVGPIYAEETHYAKPSLDGRYLYIFNAAECHITVLDLENRTIVQDIKMPSFCSQATEMIFSSDGRWMYTLNAARVGDRHVVVIDTKTRDIDHLILLPEEAKSSPANPNITISPDEQCLFVSLFHGIYRVNIESEQITKFLDVEGISFLAFTSEGKHLLGANMVTNSLDIIDPDSGKLIGSILVGDSPQYILNSPDGQRVYVSNWESGDVSVVDLSTRKVIATIPVGVNPLGMTITPDGSKLYVAVTAQALELTKEEFTTRMKVVVINTKTDAVIKEIMTGWAPRFINISRDEAKVYVGEYLGKVHIIDTASDEVVDSILLNSPITYLPDDIAITPDGSKLLVYARGIQQVLVIDTATHALLARFNASSNAIAISSDGRRVYIPGSRFTVIDIPSLTARYIETPDIGGGGTVMLILSRDERIAYIADVQKDLLQVVDLENWRLIANIPVGDMGIWAFGLAITPDGNKVFVCNGFSNDISVVSTAENRVIDTIPMKSTPVGIAISPDGRVAYITERQPGSAYQNVVAIDVATQKVVRRYGDPLGFGNAFEVAISPDGKYAYFGGSDWEMVVILDIVNGATRYVDVGLNPFYIALTKDGRLLYVSNEGSDDITVINTQTEKVVDRIPIQVKGTGFIYATLTDSRGKIVSIERPVVGFVPYDQGIQGNFESSRFAPRHRKLDGCWIPVPEGDYMLWTSTNLEGLRFVSQIYDGISNFENRAKATRVRVRENQITSVNFVLQEGHQVSGILVDKDGNPVSTGGNLVNTQTRASIGGCIGFFSDKDGRFLVNVPDGVYDLSFNFANRGVIVAKDMKAFQDVDLGKVIISP